MQETDVIKEWTKRNGIRTAPERAERNGTEPTSADLQVRSEVAHQVGGMLVRHVIDESSPLYRRTEEMMRKEDAIFKLSVVSQLVDCSELVLNSQELRVLLRVCVLPIQGLLVQ